MKKKGILLPELLAQAKSADAEERYFALQEVTNYSDDEKVLKCASDSLEDDDALVRLQALEILGKGGGLSELSVVLKATNDEDWMVRSEATISLARIVKRHLTNLASNVDNMANEEEAFRYVVAASLISENYVGRVLDGLDHNFYRIRSSALNLFCEFALEMDLSPEGLKKMKQVVSKRLKSNENEGSSLSYIKIRKILDELISGKTYT